MPLFTEFVARIKDGFMIFPPPFPPGASSKQDMANVNNSLSRRLVSMRKSVSV
jgi:hypothetical protein